jgi:hypothetical protein
MQRNGPKEKQQMGYRVLLALVLPTSSQASNVNTSSLEVITIRQFKATQLQIKCRKIFGDM